MDARPTGSDELERFSRRTFLAKAGMAAVGILGWRLEAAAAKAFSPTDPRHLRVEVLDGRVRLRWKRPRNLVGFRRYHIMRKDLGSGKLRRIATITQRKKTRFTDKGVLPGTRYRYQIWNRGKGRILGRSNRVVARLPDAAMEPPPDPHPEEMWSGEVRLTGVTIEEGNRKRLDPDRTTTVILTGNLVVRGILEMRPADPDVVHTIRFEGVDESRFVGGGMEVLSTDVGLWVMGGGQLDIQGTPRAGWNRTGSDPSWRGGDEIRVAPTAHGVFFDFPLFVPGDPVPRAYPEVPPAEVFNLTRNAVIEGTLSGRAHVFIHSTMPQTVGHALIRHMGPGALGRYPLHFHHCSDGSRESLVDGVVVRACPDRGFVPHSSHGITFRDCVAYDVGNVPFWWDAPEDGAGAHCRQVSSAHECSQTYDTLYEHCLTAKVGQESLERSGQNGFTMMAGVGNAAVDCVVVGNGGRTNAGGFHWPSRVNHDPNVWRFEDCVAHNNQINGVFVWQNDTNPHVVDGYVGYHNGTSGIEQGAYGNPYHYRDAVLVANGGASGSGHRGNLLQHSNSRTNEVTGRGAGYTRVDFHAKGRTRGAHVVSLRHNAASSIPVEWTDCRFFGEIPVLDVNEGAGSSSGFPAQLHFIHCLVNGRDIEPSDVIITLNENGTVVRGQRRDGTAWQIDELGASSIPPFWPG